MNALANVTPLHEHRPVPPWKLASDMERCRQNLRSMLQEPGLYRDDTLLEACQWLKQFGRDADKQAADAQLLHMSMRQRKLVLHRAAPPAVQAVKTRIKLDALAVAFSAAFAVGMIIYVVTL